MPPKRRKLSLEDCPAPEKRILSDIEADSGILEKFFTSRGDKLLCPAEKDGRRTKSKTPVEILSAEFKASNEAPKPTRISERLIIKRNRLGDPEESDIAGSGVTQSQTTPKKPKPARQRKKTKRRPWAQWSVRDKILFFNGLGEFGKNFEAISNKISHAARLRGLPVKDKMQVRYFYYRCWSKISKFIHLNDNGVKMKVPELYGLINYGVLKKHVKETDPQFGRCLNELILKGETTYTARNVRGKRMRVGKIRTPVCTYLKKINRIEDKKASDVAGTHKIPHQIILELTPKNSRAWARVQGMSHNPRLRFRLTTNRSLESVFQYLEKKWKSRRVRLKQSLGVTEEGDEELALFLHPSCHITDVILIPQEQQKVDVTFTSYRENILPTLKKPKKSKHAKEMKSFSEKEKLKEDAPENLAVTARKCGSEVQEICDAPMSSAEADTATAAEHSGAHSATLEPESIFMKHLASCLGNQASFSQKDTANSGNFTDATLDASIAPAVIMEDENAMFPDSSPFSDQTSASGEGSGKSTTPPSPPPADQPCSILIPPVILSPTVSKKKSTKYCKKASGLEDNLTPFDNCDGKMAASGSDHSSSPSKTDSSASAWEELKDHLEKDIVRITNLAKEGFVAKTASNVTLLHLSLILGRASVIKLEYEWKPKRLPKVQPPAFLNQAAIQMSNVLRRLCNLATLELADLAASERIAEQNKSSLKNVPCSNCHRSSKLKNKRQGHSESREIATMTDPLKMECTPLVPVFQPAALLAANNRTFIASTSSPAAVQIAGPDPVFRVPVIPSAKPSGPSTEEQQREQMQANAIIQQGVSPHNKLLKRRPAQLRNRKAPPIVVQRTLLPKVDAGQVVTFVQPVVSQSVSNPLVVEVPPNQLMKVTQPLANGPSLASHPQLIELSPNQLLKLAPSGLSNHIIVEVPPDSMGIPQPLASPNPVIVMSGDPAMQVSQPVVSSSMVMMSSDQVLMTNKMAASSSPMVVSPDQVVMVPELPISSSIESMLSDQVVQGVQSVVSSSMGLGLSHHNVILYSQTGDAGSTPSFTTDLHQSSSNSLSNSINFENGMLSEQMAASNMDPSTSEAAVGAIGSKAELQLSMSSQNVFSANLFSSSPETEPPLRTSAVSALSASGDITISDLDISLSSVIVGAESGDKFLDMILQNSEQGFSGLISTPKKSAATPVTFNPLSSPSVTTFDPAGLRTPPRISRPAYMASSLFQIPIKLGIPSQAWISSEDGDLSLGSVVGESPIKEDCQKSTSNASIIPTSIGFFGTVSSNMPDRGSSIFSKPSSASELSLSSLLAESVFKKDDTLDVSPPISLSSDTDLRADNHEARFFEIVGTPHLFSEVSTDSLMKLEEDKALQSVVNESSLDLVSNFELLATQIAGQVDTSLSRDKQEPSLEVWAPKCG